MFLLNACFPSRPQNCAITSSSTDHTVQNGLLLLIILKHSLLMQEEARAKEKEEEEPSVVCCLDFESHFSLVRPPKWPRLVKNHENLQELPQKEVRVLKQVTSIPRIGKEPKSGHGYSFWCVPVWLSLLPAAECQQSKPA